MRKSTACPDPEVLAAFLDGRLSGDERRRVVAHLDACPDCYEVFAETVRFQGEEAPRGRVVGVGRFGSRRWLWPAAAAAAAVLLAVLVAVPVLRMEPERAVVATLPPGDQPEATAEALVTAIAVADEAELVAAARPKPPEEQGLGFGAGRTSEEAVSFQAGVALVERAAAARARAAGADVEEAAPRAVTGEDPFFVSFGMWAEAGRLAAAVGDAELFRSEVFTGFESRLDEAELPSDVSELVAKIRAIPSDDTSEPLEEADLEALQKLFNYLVALYY